MSTKTRQLESSINLKKGSMTKSGEASKPTPKIFPVPLAAPAKPLIDQSMEDADRNSSFESSSSDGYDNVAQKKDDNEDGEDGGIRINLSRLESIDEDKPREPASVPVRSSMVKTMMRGQQTRNTSTGYVAVPMRAQVSLVTDSETIQNMT